MKIGVVTFWYGNDNYGMILQCWALQKFLKKLGQDPYVIKYVPEGCLLKRIAVKLLCSILSVTNKERKKMKAIQAAIQAANEKYYKERGFEDFRNRYLTFSKRKYSCIESLRLLPPYADCYICGSDQIWRSLIRKKNSAGFFLSFGKKNIRRIAYAPSFGLKEYPLEDMPLLRNYLSNFDFLSCREWDGVEICKKVGCDAAKVDDPTLLLSKEDYLPIISDRLYTNYVFIYSLNISNPLDIYWERLKKECVKHNFVVTPASGYMPSREIFGIDVIYKYSTPSEWISLVANSELVVTSSFHGIVFSIIFNRKFAFVPLKEPYASANNRVLELLKELELEYTIISKESTYSRIMNTEFDWHRINALKEKMLNKSKNYLELSLKDKY